MYNTYIKPAIFWVGKQRVMNLLRVPLKVFDALVLLVTLGLYDPDTELTVWVWRHILLTDLYIELKAQDKTNGSR